MGISKRCKTPQEMLQHIKDTDYDNLGAMWKKAVKLLDPDDTGCSEWKRMEDFPPDFKLGNGSTWNRPDGEVYKYFKVELGRKKLDAKSKILEIRLCGIRLKKTPKSTQPIREDIVSYICKQQCAMTGTHSNVEVDHRYGDKKSMQRLSDLKSQNVQDFQPLTRNSNANKREVCKKCNTKGVRFDACTLEYPIPWWRGNHSLKRSGCSGCFWCGIAEYRTYIGPLLLKYNSKLKEYGMSYLVNKEQISNFFLKVKDIIKNHTDTNIEDIDKVLQIMKEESKDE